MQNTPKTIEERLEEITETVNNTKYVEAHLVVELLTEQDRISKESFKEKIERLQVIANDYRAQGTSSEARLISQVINILEE